MRYLATITMLILALAMVQPVAAVTLRPIEFGKWDYNGGMEAYKKKDYATALKHFSATAVKGDARAQYSLGWMYHQGEGVTKNYKQALRWLRKAAEQGHVVAVQQIDRLEEQLRAEGNWPP